MNHLSKALRLLGITLFFSGQCFAKNTSITADFTVRSLDNNHFSFIAVVTSSQQSVSYYWDFGDGTILWWSNNDIVNHTFAATGAYIVKLTARNSSGDSSTVSRFVTARVNPMAAVADFSYSPTNIFPGDTVQFTNTSANSSGPVTASWWIFEDGASFGAVENPRHVFTQPGVYSVYLTAGRDTTIKTIRVLAPGAYANFSFTSMGGLCTNSPVQFLDLSFSNMGPIVSWYWQFGGGATSTVQNPVYSFFYRGSRSVTLIVTDITGQKDTASQLLSIGHNTAIDFTYSPQIIYTGDSVQLFDNSVQICSNISEWEWSVYGPGSFHFHSFSQVPPPVVFPNAGTGSIALFINGDTAEKLITVYPGSKKTICPGGTAVMNASVAGSTYQWQESIDNGTNWHNLQNDGITYSGVQTNTLTVSNASSSWYGNLYRCFTDTIPAVKYKLEFVNQYNGTGTWEDTANWSCQMLPDENTDVIISSGTVTLNSNAVCRSIKVMPGANIIVTPGYNLTIIH